MTTFFTRLRHWVQQSKLLQNSLVRAANTMFLMRIFFLGMAFLNRFILARILGEEGLGTFYYALSWVDILLIFAVFGLDRLMVREIAAAMSDDRPDIAHGLLRFGNWFSIIVSVGIMIAAMIAIAFTPLAANFSEITIAALLLAMLLVPLRSNIRLRQTAMQGFERMASSLIPEHIVTPVVFMALIGGAWWLLRDDFTVATAMLLYVITILIAVGLGVYLLMRVTPPEVQNAPSTLQIQDWFQGALPLILLSGMGVLNSRVDVLMLGSLGTLADVGIYTTAAQIATLLNLILTVSNTALAPRFARLYNTGEHVRLQRLVTRSSRWILLVSAIMAMGLLLTGPYILRLFGTSFVTGTTVLNLIIIGQMVNVFFGSVATLLIMSSFAWYSAAGLIASSIVNISLNLVLIPTYGMNGAALASLVSLAIWNILLGIFVWRKLRIIPTAVGKL